MRVLDYKDLGAKKGIKWSRVHLHLTHRSGRNPLNQREHAQPNRVRESRPEAWPQGTLINCGAVHVPSSASVLGQYRRKIMENGPSGAGSQFDSLSSPGESC